MLFRALRYQLAGNGWNLIDTTNRRYGTIDNNNARQAYG